MSKLNVKKKTGFDIFKMSLSGFKMRRSEFVLKCLQYVKYAHKYKAEIVILKATIAFQKA